MRYLGLDLGSRTLGMALTDMTKTIASSYKVIRHNEEYDLLIDFIGRWHLGLDINMNYYNQL